MKIQTLKPEGSGPSWELLREAQPVWSRRDGDPPLLQTTCHFCHTGPGCPFYRVQGGTVFLEPQSCSQSSTGSPRACDRQTSDVNPRSLHHRKLITITRITRLGGCPGAYKACSHYVSICYVYRLAPEQPIHLNTSSLKNTNQHLSFPSQYQ